MEKVRVLSVLMAVICAGWGAEAAGQYSGGTGEPNTPYEIANVDDLLALAGIVYDHIKQAFCG